MHLMTTSAAHQQGTTCARPSTIATQILVPGESRYSSSITVLIDGGLFVAKLVSCIKALEV